MRKFGTLVALVAVTLGVTLMLPSAANAATAGTTINCRAQINYPHNSSHVNGVVNVVGTITCDSPVTQISATISLYRNGVLMNSWWGYQMFGTYLSVHTETPCVNAAYYGNMAVTVQFPPNSSPPVGYANVTTPTLGITC